MGMVTDSPSQVGTVQGQVHLYPHGSSRWKRWDEWMLHMVMGAYPSIDSDWLRQRRAAS